MSPQGLQSLMEPNWSWAIFWAHTKDWQWLIWFQRSRRSYFHSRNCLRLCGNRSIGTTVLGLLATQWRPICDWLVMRQWSINNSSGTWVSKRAPIFHHWVCIPLRPVCATLHHFATHTHIVHNDMFLLFQILLLWSVEASKLKHIVCIRSPLIIF